MLTALALHLATLFAAKYPMINRNLFKESEFTRFVLHRPEPAGTALIFDQPWEGKESGYATVISDGEQGYRIYYKAGGEGTREYTCVASSKDGLSWTRLSRANPKITSREFPNLNAVWTGKEPGYFESHNFFPFIDTNPLCDPNEKWKAVGIGRYVKIPGRKMGLVGLTSADGLNWKLISETPVLNQGDLDSLNVVFYDSALQKYVCYFREGKSGVRWVKRATSSDFRHWELGQWLEIPGLEATQLYTNGVQPYPGVRGSYVAMPMRFVPERKVVGDPPKKTDGVSDGLLLFSSDGLRFGSPTEIDWIRPGRDPENWGDAHGNNTPCVGIVTKESEWLVYWMDRYGTTPRIAIGRLRPDGLISLHFYRPDATTTSSKIALNREPLFVNFSTSAAGRLEFELRDGQGREIDGYRFRDFTPLFGDSLRQELKWRGKSTKELPGGSYLLVVRGFEADLYAVMIGLLSDRRSTVRHSS